MYCTARHVTLTSGVIHEAMKYNAFSAFSACGEDLHKFSFDWVNCKEVVGNYVCID